MLMNSVLNFQRKGTEDRLDYLLFGEATNNNANVFCPRIITFPLLSHLSSSHLVAVPHKILLQTVD